jgi:hypothetical protein
MYGQINDAGGFEFLKCPQRLSIEINIFLLVNVYTSWLIMLVA